MHLLTLAFDMVATLGGFYLTVGFVLHLTAAWKSCTPRLKTALAPGASTAEVQLPVDKKPAGRKPTELEALAAWNERFGIT
ncbi:MAG: hypothetical protein ACFB4J_13545 [Elainellaceae cyanobacterium]